VATIVGEAGLTEADRLYLAFADEFERRFIGQGETERSIDETLRLVKELLGGLAGVSA